VWSGLWVPHGTPAPIVAKLAAAVREALADANVRKRFEAMAIEIPPPDRLGPAPLAALQRAEIETWWPMIKAMNIKGA
jgi:tripartite-type tricarboxylate transporter receptor subunit TctC